jgi:hypothetical protein
VLGGLLGCGARRAAVINPSAELRALLTHGARLFSFASSAYTRPPRQPLLLARLSFVQLQDKAALANNSSTVAQSIPSVTSLLLSLLVPLFVCASALRPFCLRIRVQDLVFGVFLLESPWPPAHTPPVHLVFTGPQGQVH